MKMRLVNCVINLFSLITIDAFVIRNVNDSRQEVSDNWKKRENDLTNVFNGVYSECFFHLSYSCIQKKTLLYLNELNKLSEVSVIGDYVKFVKVNTTEEDEINPENEMKGNDTKDLSFLIDKAVDKFFNNHVMTFSALGNEFLVPNTVEEFVGRKRRKGGGGGHHDGDHDGGKKKMMMMAMMCMKMKLMMMVPAMMGMMGMMSFKGMMFSMMSFMIAKMMLLMKLLEKKGGSGGLGGGDGGWPAGGGGGGAWMPAGGDYGGGATGGGYDANGQWQSRSIIDKSELEAIHNKPITSYVTPFIRFENIDRKPVIKANKDVKPKSRSKRGIVDILQYAYAYWSNRLLGNALTRRKLRQPNYKYVNGVKYVYYPMKVIQKFKQPKELQASFVKAIENTKQVLNHEDFNKGEIVEGVIESRMNKKKFHKLKDSVNETIDENPWE